MSISLTPLEDKIIVKQAEVETQTASGLFIPTMPRRSRSRAKSWLSARAVVTTPAKVSRSTSRSAAALYSKYGGTEVHYQGEDYLIVSARDILAILG